jgi:alkanesulfonate monooxygenase SsuD/methylene tetrahydromethanopterin reductase-like flavin-dependent oxidoreductase (luciferase family)
MDFGIMTAKVDEIGYITRAENLGYTHAWVTDSPMIRSNCWAVLALAAHQTRTIRLGTGVNVPGLARHRGLRRQGHGSTLGGSQR